MRTAFADTYFYLALVSGDDAGHNKAAEFAATWNGRTITTAWVLTEIADALADPSQRPVFASLLLSLQHDSQLTIVPPSQDQNKGDQNKGVRTLCWVFCPVFTQHDVD